MKANNGLFIKGMFFYNLKKLFFVPLIHFAWLLFTSTIPMILDIADINEGLSGENLYWRVMGISTNIINMANPVYIMIISIFCGVCISRYLYKTRSAVAIHSLPLTRGALHFTNIITGLFMIMVPLIVNALILLGICSPYSEIMYPQIGTALVLSLLFTLFFFGLAEFSCMATGSVFGAAIIYFIFNVIQPGILITMELLAMPFSWGINFDIWYYSWYYLSPVIALRAGPSSYSALIYDAVSIPLYIWLCALAGILLLVVSLLFYKKKNIESAGSILPMAFTRPIFRWGISFAAASVVITMINFSEDFARPLNKSLAIMVICFAIISPLVFILIQMLIKKSFRVINRKLLMECIVMVVIFIGISFAIRFDVTGVKKYVPDISNIEQVSIRGGNNVEYTLSKAETDKIINLHKNLVDNEEQLREYPDTEKDIGYMHLEIEYVLKNGLNVIREYNYNYVPGEGLKSDIADSAMDIFNHRDKIKNYLFEGKDIKGQLYTINAELRSGYFKSQNESEDTSLIGGNIDDKDDILVLKEAIIKDIDNGDLKLVDYSPHERAGYVNLQYRYQPETPEDFADKTGLPPSQFSTLPSDYFDYVFIDLNQDCKNTIQAIRSLYK